MKLYSHLYGLLLFLLLAPSSTEESLSSSNSVMCTLTVDAGPDITICEPGQTVTLFGNIFGDFLDVEWTPSTGLSNPNSPITDATVFSTTTYTLTATSLDGNNLIVNPNFDGGLTGFTSDYIPGTGGAFGLLSGEGQFAVATNAADTHTNFAPCTDHTGGGNMLVVNGAGVPNQDVWCQTVPVNPGTDYAFSAWVTSVISSSPAQLQFSVNGMLIGGIYTASASTCAWGQFNAIWNSGGSSTAEICIVNQNTATSGNDFALDDLSFGELCEATDQVTITVIDLNADFFPPNGLCPLSPIIDLNTLLSPMATPGGMWTINGIPTQFLDPFILGPGLHTIEYTVTQAPCSETNTQTFFIEPLPDPGWIVPDVCFGTPPFDLNSLLMPGAEPGGVWTIDGTQNNIFDPASLGAGPHLVSYSVGTPPCVSTLEQFIDVDPLPNAGWSVPADVCVGTPAILLDNLLDANATPGGTWTINGSQDVIFDPAVLGPGIHTVSYSVGTFPCANDLIQNIEVGAAPQAPEPVCGPTTSSSILFVWPAVPNATGYTVTVITSQQGTLVDNTFSVTGLAPGENVQIQVTAMFDGPCGNSTSEIISCNSTNCDAPDISINGPDSVCLDIMIAPFDLTYTIDGDDLGTPTWSGSGIVDPVNGTFDHFFAGPGIHTVTLTYEIDNCTSTATYDIEVFEIPTAEFNFPSPICQGDTIEVIYTGTADITASYDWGFEGATIISGSGQGPYTLFWNTSGSFEISLSVEENNCSSGITTAQIVVDPPLLAPSINCSSTDSEVTFFWPEVENANAYLVDVLQGPMGSFDADTSYTVSGLNAGDEVIIELTIESANACDQLVIEHTCVAENCPDVTINIPQIEDICLSDSIIYDLSAMIDGGTGTGDGEWSGPGITDTDVGLFDPIEAGIGTHQVTYTYTESANCIYSATTTIEIPAVPIADFSAPDTICIEDIATIDFTGMALNDANYIWDFDDGNILSGSDEGPYEIQWSDAGLKTISLTVEENGCNSATITREILVDPLLEAPVIDCDPSFSSILFTWNRLTSTEGYQVNVIDGPPGDLLVDTAYQISNLMPGTSVTLEVIALSDNTCPSSSTEITCSTLPCPDIDLNIEAVPALCFDGNNPAIDLEYTVAGDTTGSVVSWSGNGIQDAQTGIWQVDASMIGQDNWVFVELVQDVCVVTDSFNITVFQQPEAAFTLDSVLCVSDNTTINFTGIATDSATFNWIFNPPLPYPISGPGPHSIQFDQAGTYTLALEIEDNGCVSTSSTTTILVEPLLDVPVISCEATFTSIEFSWEAVDNANDYAVEVLSGPTGSFTSPTSYLVENLNPEQMVTIEVTANSNNSCPNSSTEFSCSSLPCPMVDLSIAALGPICFSPDLDPIQLVYTINGDNPSGQLSWSGNGITDTDNGIFEVQASMIDQTNRIYLTYTEDICTYVDSFDIQVFAIPTADFTAPDLICVLDEANISYTGTAGTGASYSWSFESAVPPIASGPGPHQVSWPNAGTYEISLMVEENGCTSTLQTHSITVDPSLELPLINCEADYNEIIFSWNSVQNAANYALNWSYDGNSFSQLTTDTFLIVSDLLDDTEVTLELIVESANACPSVNVPITCSSLDCPEASLSITYPEAICEGDDTNLTFFFDGNTGPFDVTLLVGANPMELNGLSNGQSIDLDLTETTTFSVQSIINTAAPVCPVGLPDDFTVTVNTLVNAGVPANDLVFCSGLDTFILLADLLDQEDLGGSWSEISAQPSTDNAFNANSGLFAPEDQAAGTYTFQYTVEAVAPCPNEFSTVSIIIEPTPVADAGEDMTIDCVMDMVSLGGSQTSAGTVFDYQWLDSGGNPISNATDPFWEVQTAGNYTLEVTNTENGCSASDEVIVETDISVLNPNVSISPISCFQANDGLISVDGIEGGAPPYLYALNGGSFSSQSFFSNLTPGNYVLTIRDSKGCETQLEFNFDQPEEIQVRLVSNLEGDQELIQLGDSVILSALVNVPAESIDTLIWYPDSLNCPGCPNQTVAPQTTTAYSVMVIDENGCTDDDNITLFVEKVRDVFIPNAFSPNNDGINDIAMIFAGQEIEEIHTFQIFNRWGEIVYEAYNFQPNIPDHGWNGIFRGKPMNPAIFIYYAEIEFIDGAVEIFKGDIALVK